MADGRRLGMFPQYSFHTFLQLDAHRLPYYLFTAMFFAATIFADKGKPTDQSTADIQAVQKMVELIDTKLEAKWKQDGVKPGAEIDDALFLRRATLDLLGRIPSVAEIHAYLDDQRPDKRAHLVRSLLARPESAAALGRTWRRVLIPNGSPGFQQATTLDAWLTQEFRRDLRYDQFVRDVLTSTGLIEPNRSTVFYGLVGREPENLAEVSARSFLGIRIGCAKCHDHPLAEWKKADYWKFAAFFSGLKPANPIANQQPNMRVSVDDPLVFTIKPADSSTIYIAAVLKGEQTKDTKTSPRKQLADWITGASNPWFTAHFVNRTWQQLIGQPIVSVVDDLDTVSAAERSALLNPLSDEVTRNDFRVKLLIQAIMLSKMYRLASINEGTSGQPSNEPAANSAVVRRALKSLSAEQVYDSLEQSLGLPIDTAARTTMSAERNLLLTRLREGASDVPTEFSSGVPQSLLLMNGQFIRNGTDLAGSRTLRAIADAPYLSDQERIENLYLATLTRLPTQAEQARVNELLNATSSNRQQVFADVFWVLLNSPEFVLCR